jgi:outer membrane protein assembly factor BamE (lipoprotein component of BamABCDE complex)
MDRCYRFEKGEIKMKKTSLLLILLLALSVACGPTITKGRWINADNRKEIVNGQTTADRVVELFGKPETIEKLPSGGEKYIYTYYRQQYDHWWTLPKIDDQKLEISIKDGMVQDYVFTREYRGEITEKDRE